MRVKTTKIILASIMLIMALMIGISTYSTQQQKTTASQASETDTWQQCNDDFSNTPCGVCSIDNVINGQVDFNCRLECGESEEDCPEGPGTQNISAKWITCDNSGEETCDSAQDDFRTEAAVQNSPWILNKQSSSNFVGTFPQIQCGRGSVEILIDAAGVDVTEAVFDTQVACNLPTSGPSPTTDPAASPGVTTTVTISPQVSTSPNPSPQLTTTVIPTAAISESPSPSITKAVSATPPVTVTTTTAATPTVTQAISLTPTSTEVYESPTQPPPVSGSAAPFVLIAIPFMLMLLGFAL